MANVKKSGIKSVDLAVERFDVICERARQQMYDRVMLHYKRNPRSPWSGAPLVQLEKTIRAIYASWGKELKGEFRETLPAVMREFYDKAAAEIKKTGAKMSTVGEPDTALVKRSLDNSYTQVAMKTEQMAFSNIRDLRALSAEVFREASLTGATRKEVSKRLLEKAMNIKGFEFIDNAGRNWKLKSYFEMLARTELMNAGRAAYDEKCAADGYDVVVLSVSGNACDKCASFEGRLFSLSGATPGLPTKADLEAAGVFHPNCTHSYSAVPEFIRKTDYDARGRPIV